MEIWKIIEDFENYEVSSYGNIRSNQHSKKRILKLDSTKGYLRVTLSKFGVTKRFQVHRLVAISFLENLDQKPCVNHIDGNRLNNSLSNLEWCTYSENEKHSYDVLGKINHNRKLNEEQVKDIRNNCIIVSKKNMTSFPWSIKSFMIKYNISRNTVLNVLNKKYYV